MTLTRKDAAATALTALAVLVFLATTLLVVAIGLALPFSPLASVLGFRALPPLFFAILVGMIVTYLALAELGKAWFFRHLS